MANLPSTYEIVDRCISDLRWVAIIVCAYVILDWINDDDEDPDGYA